MKVAIIGAGLSGLAAAFEFKKNGIIPVIFEKKSRIGQDTITPTLTLKIFERFHRGPSFYFKYKYGLNIPYYLKITGMTMKSRKNNVYIKGNTGYVFTRGRHKNSIENQLYSQSQVPINFDSYIRLKDIKGSFDYIVASNGNSCIAKELGIWTNTFCSHVRTAIIPGYFSSDSLVIWFNTDYSKNCFSALIPNSPTEAVLLLIANNTSLREMDFYWNEFIFKENIRYPVSQFNELELNQGFPAYLYKDNIFFTGNAAGAIDNFIGFGAFNAIESGILAARSIIHSLDYNVLMKPIITSVKRLNKYRLAVDTFQNSGYDRLVKFLGSRFVKSLVYYNPFFKLENFSFMPNIYSKIYNDNINKTD